MQQRSQIAADDQRQQDAGAQFDSSYGFFYPRWPLLAALAMCLFTLVGLGLRLYYLHHYCPLGSLCYMDLWPAWLQFLILLLAFLLLWFVASLFVGYLEAPDLFGSRTTKLLVHFFRSISDFEPVRWIIIGFGGLMLVLLLLSSLLRGFRFEPVPDALIVMVLCVALCALFRRIPRPYRVPTPEEQRLQAIARERSPWRVLRGKLAPRSAQSGTPAGAANTGQQALMPQDDI